MAGAPRTLRVLGVAGAVVLGAVLLFAAALKALDPVAFAEQIEHEGLAGLVAAGTVALVALAIESGLGTALLLGVRHRWVLAPATALVVFFLFLTGRAYWLAAHGVAGATDCGCFGNLVPRSPAVAFWSDLALLGIPLALAFVGRGGARAGFPKVRVAAALAVAAATVALAVAAPGLPLDDWATRVAPGVEVASLCTGSDRQVCLDDVAPELHEGDHWVVLADLQAPGDGWVDALSRYALSGDGPSPVVVTSAPPEAVHAFVWQWGPTFEIREGPQALLRPLYRRLPRSFRVAEGRVIETVPGLPPPVVADERAAGGGTQGRS